MDFKDREAQLQNRYKRIKADAEKIHALVKENLEYFKAEEDSDHWRTYIEYVDDVVLDGLFECVRCSLSYLLENTDNKKEDMPPLLEAKLELQVSVTYCGYSPVHNHETKFCIQAPEMVFQPSLGQDSADSLHRLMESVLVDIFNFGSLVPRVAKHKDIPHYHNDVEDVCTTKRMSTIIMYQ